MQGIKPTGLCSPWSEYKKKQWFTNIKMKQTTLRCITKNVQGLTQWSQAPFGWHLPTQLQTWISWGTDLNPINIFMVKG